MRPVEDSAVEAFQELLAAEQSAAEDASVRSLRRFASFLAPRGGLITRDGVSLIHGIDRSRLCRAANDLAGDPLDNLGYGARSAGLGVECLRRLLRELETMAGGRGADALVVTVEISDPRKEGSNFPQSELIGLYQEAGFETSTSGASRLVLRLPRGV